MSTKTDMTNVVPPPAMPVLTAFARDAEQAVRADAHEPAWLVARRSEAMRRLLDRGLPTRRDEAWIYTDTRPLTQTGHRLAGAPTTLSQNSPALEGLLHLSPFAPCLVLRNGVLDETLSRLDDRFVSVTSRADIERGPLLERLLGTVANVRGSGWCDASLACHRETALVHLPRGHVAEGPVLVVHIAAPSEARDGGHEPELTHPRLLIVAEANADAQVIEVFLREEGGPGFTNAVTEVVLETGARVRHKRLQLEGAEHLHLGTTAVHLDRDANYEGVAITLGGKVMRHEIYVDVTAPGANCELDGLYVLHGREHADTHVVLDHQAPNGTSRQLYKGILDEHARGAFTGRVIVRREAQKTEATQANHNLLLSPDAVAETRPQLEIYADDVRCAHGATVGQLDDEAVLYLQARGIGAEAARSLLIRAFAHEVIDRTRHPTLRQDLHRILEDRLAEAAGRKA